MSLRIYLTFYVYFFILVVLGSLIKAQYPLQDFGFFDFYNLSGKYSENRGEAKYLIL